MLLHIDCDWYFHGTAWLLKYLKCLFDRCEYQNLSIYSPPHAFMYSKVMLAPTTSFGSETYQAPALWPSFPWGTSFDNQLPPVENICYLHCSSTCGKFTSGTGFMHCLGAGRIYIPRTLSRHIDNDETYLPCQVLEYKPNSRKLSLAGVF